LPDVGLILSCGPVHTRSIWARAGNCTDWTAAQSALQKWRISSLYAVRICNSSSRESGVKTLVAAKIGQPSIIKSVQVIEKASRPSKRSRKPARERLTQCYGLFFSWFLRAMKIWIMFICINVYGSMYGTILTVLYGTIFILYWFFAYSFSIYEQHFMAF
jgi:hypothetical protein